MNSQEPEKFRFLPKAVIAGALGVSDKISLFFVRLKFTPATLTVLGLLAGLAAGILFALGHPLWAWLAIIVCGFADTIDGRVAARTNKRSAFGAILDSSFDRYTEFFIYTGLAVAFLGRWLMGLAALAFLGSTMVSYTRARAESLGFECKIGMMQRAERLFLVGAGAFIGSVFNIYDAAMITALALVGLFSNITAVQRIFYVQKVERDRAGKGDVSGHE